MAPTHAHAAARSAAEDTARSARRFGTYVRWTLYSFSLIEAAYLGQIILLANASNGAGEGLAVSPATWVGVLAGLAHVVLDVAVCRWAFRHMRTPGPWPRALLVVWVATGLIAIAGFLPWFSPRTPWPVVIPAITVISLTMVLPLMRIRAAVVGAGLVAVVVAVCGALMGMPWGYRVGYMVFGAFVALSLPLSAWSFVWMLRVLFQLQDAQEAQARLAVTDERLRISRDLHDVFGRTLAAISVKAELASELARRERSAEAAGELSEIRAIADSAGKEVRRVVRGEATVGLAQELDGAKSLLTSAGITTTVAGEPEAVAGETGDVLAWVVREAVTNVLRHSVASQASVSVTSDDEATTLIVANDGAEPRGTSGTRTGIASMRERLAPLGGTLEVTHDGGWFTLVATLPAGPGGATTTMGE